MTRIERLGQAQRRALRSFFTSNGGTGVAPGYGMPNGGGHRMRTWKSLEKLNLVSVHCDPRSGNTWWVHITARGRSFHAQAWPVEHGRWTDIWYAQRKTL